MEALDLHVEDGVGVDVEAAFALDVVGQAHLVVVLGAAHLLQEGGVVLEFDELGELVGVIEPARADGLGDELGIGRVRFGEEATVRDAVRLVVELLGGEHVEVFQSVALQDVGMDLGHAVHRVAADHREARHAHLAVPEHGGLAQAILPVGRGAVEVVAPAAADLLDDHVEAREQLGEGVDGPLLERLGQDRVVGVGDGFRGDIPRLVPLEALLVDEDAHELRAAHGRVGIVGVDRDVLGQELPVGAVLAAEGVEHAREARRHEEVFLLKAQEPSVLTRVVGVEDGADGLGFGAMTVRCRVVAAVEGFEVEDLLDGLRAPDAQLVDGLGAIAHHGDVVGYGEHVLGIHGAEAHAPVALILLDMAAEADADGLVRAAHLPWVAVGEPFVGGLVLGAVHDLLLEEAVAITHAVAVARDALVRHGVEEAGGEAAQAAIAERRIGLVLLERVEVAPKLGQAVLHKVMDAKVQQVVIEQTTDQELD